MKVSRRNGHASGLDFRAWPEFESGENGTHNSLDAIHILTEIALSLVRDSFGSWVPDLWSKLDKSLCLDPTSSAEWVNTYPANGWDLKTIYGK